MRTRPSRLLTVAAVTAALLAGCETDGADESDDVDADLERLEDDSGDGEPIEESDAGTEADTGSGTDTDTGSDTGTD